MKSFNQVAPIGKSSWRGGRPVMFLISALLVLPAGAQQCPPFQSEVQVGEVAHSSLDEISGLAVSRNNQDVLWVHNDSGDQPARIFAMNPSGAHLGIYNLSGAQAIDYEDIAIGPGSGPGTDPNTDYLYVADTGNNSLNRSTVTVYRVAEPTASATQSAVNVDLAGVDALPMHYPNPGPRYDCETLLVDPGTGDLYLVTRDRGGVSGDVSFVFKNPAPHVPGVDVELQLVTSIPAPVEIKGGDISPDGTQILLRPASADDPIDARWWPWDGVTSLATVFAQPACPVPAASEPQGEAIAFAADGLSYYTISEDANQPIYQYTLATPPIAPDSLVAVAQSSSEIALDWNDNSNDEDGFEIYESSDGTNFSLVATTGADATSTSVNGLAAATRYDYFVRAYNVGGGGDSNVAWATTFSPTPPAAPSSLTANAQSSSQIELAWVDNSNNEDGFEIYESTDDVSYTLIFTTAPDATGALVSGLQADSTYFYYIRAKNTVGFADSTKASATTLPPAPVSLFSDGFESGGLTAGGWSVVSPATVTSSAAHAGSYGALLKKSSGIIKTIGTSGATTTDLSYWRRVSGLNNGEFFFAEWSPDGNNWTILEQTGGSAPWGLIQRQIAVNSSTFHLRFRLTGNKGNDLGMVDEVLLTANLGTPNTAPAAGGDSFVVDEDAGLAVGAPGVLDNDTDPEEDVLTAYLVDPAAFGSVVLNGDGSFDYTPNPDFNGTDSFTYVASDGLADSPAATVTITVNPVPDAPVASGDTYSVGPNSTLMIDAPGGVLANDFDADGEDLEATLVPDNGPANGVLVLQLDGSFTYTPNLDFIGTDSFVYAASDGNSIPMNATVMITVQSAGPAAMHIESIFVSHLSLSKGQKRGYAEVVVLDEFGDPVMNASVTGTFSEDIGEEHTVTTDAAGVAVFTTTATVKGSITLTFCVDEVVHAVLPHDPLADLETCDSNY